MKKRLFLLMLLPILSSCGAGVCLNQAECPDGSWSVGDGGGGDGDGELTGSFADFIASLQHRDKMMAQKTLKEELTLGTSALPSGYRKVPDLTKDDDGYSGGSVTFASRPTQVCGTTQNTVEARVAQCAELNAALASWDGSVVGNAGQALWKLVTYNGTHEVWRDERTGLLWSDRLGQTNWCRATGSSGGGPYGQVDPYNFCDNVLYQPIQATPESWCTEDAGFNTPGAYDSMKGGMRLAATPSSPSISWRLPTLYDYQMANIDGIRFVLPNMTAGAAWAWTSTIVSPFRDDAWYFFGDLGYFNSFQRMNGAGSVRCLGR